MTNDSYFNRVNAPRLKARQVDELIGLAKGIAADGELANSELDYLVRWLVANREITQDPLVSALYRQIQAMLGDGVFTDEERSELLGLLKDFASHPMEMGEPMLSTAVPFTNPLPTLEFGGRRYCFTGTFAFGTRDACENIVAERGAVAGSLTKNTDVLVVGHYATESWLHSPYGLKIIKAKGMQDKGHPIAIVPEHHWSTHL
jgi:NAD-dependent DNA ligase